MPGGVFRDLRVSDTQLSDVRVALSELIKSCSGESSLRILCGNDRGGGQLCQEAQMRLMGIFGLSCQVVFSPKFI